MATTYTSTISLAKMATSDPFDVTLLNGNADTTDAAIKKAYQGKAARNWLDNSDFAAPINQRGASSYTSGYSIDRWKVNHYTGSGTLTVRSENIQLEASSASTSAEIVQILSLPAAMTGQTMTFAVNCAELGTLVLRLTYGTNNSLTTSDGTVSLIHYSGTNFVIRVIGTTARTFYWAALYEGSYTADTLPAYVPKGYAAELAECQRYYQRWYRVFGSTVGNVSREALHLTPQMRIAPTASIASIWQGSTDAAVTINSTASQYVDVSYTGWGNATIALSADL